MRSPLIAALLLASTAAYGQANAPAGDVPTKEAKAEAEKPDADTVKASVEEDAQPVRPRHGVLQQRGLADARLTAQDEGAAASRTGLVEQLAEGGLLRLATDNHGRKVLMSYWSARSRYR